MTKFLFFGFIFIGFLNGIIYSQDSVFIPEANIDIFSKLLSKSFTEIQDKLTVTGKEEIYLLKSDKNNPETNYFALEIKRGMNNFKIITSADIKSGYKILINNLVFKINYTKNSNNYFTNKTYDRHLSIGYNYKIIKNPGDSLIYSGSSNEKFSDNFKIEYMEQIERSNYEFTKGVLPKQNFLNKILIPAIVVAATLITIVLFYSIRSK